MLCAECPRCRRRSIIGVGRPILAQDPAQDSAQAPEPGEAPARETLRLRCDLCGSRDVKIHDIPSPMQAIRFISQRG